MMETCVRVALCLLLGKGLLASAVEVRGRLGGAVTLPCALPSEESEEAYGCWGRERCDTFTCNEEILSIDKLGVIWRISHRHQLLGNVTQGNMSLTITDVTREDQGTYCCKIKVKGWFHDDDKTVTTEEHMLKVHEGPTDGTKNSADGKSQEMAEGSSVARETSHSPTTITVVVLFILIVGLLGLLSAWKCYKIRTKNKAGHMLLEDLQEETQEAEQNVSI
ncbi:T-cell immunoglobulin and mucin domain-containing protein 4-like [Hyperolius riggenbachi]|uniref:T-cell immunoglobulin and mucin domain-containing protein 4-like n=1 Tax=Hyperolius riggenbachi TaxID=752182 RepID=UPI0035A2D0AC